MTGVQVLRGQETVESRIEQLGPAVDLRLRPAFRAAGLAYPPDAVTLIILKQERRIQLWASYGNSGIYAYVKTYPVLGLSGQLGPKLREGDMQVPEGLYAIQSLNPNSR